MSACGVLQRITRQQQQPLAVALVVLHPHPPLLPLPLLPLPGLLGVLGQCPWDLLGGLNQGAALEQPPVLPYSVWPFRNDDEKRRWPAAENVFLPV